MSKLSNDSALALQKQQAIDWLVKLRSDDLDDDELLAFADWLAQDHAHSEAFAAAEVLFEQMSLAAQAVAETDSAVLNEGINAENELNHPVPEQKKTHYNVRERLFSWLVPSVALLATWLIVVNLILPQQMHLLDNLSSDFYTLTGELREVQLSDGSQLLLNTNSAVSVEYTNAKRSIILHHGQVRFAVAKDNHRPFEVDIDGLIVRALGTVFQIHKNENNSVKVTVQEHAVAVHQRQNEDYRINVKVGQQLQHDLGQELEAAVDIILTQETAWQSHRLIINDQPLGDLIAELERYKNGRIFLSDQTLKHLRVTGVFSLNNPDAILNSICKVLDLKQTQVGGWWSILHR